MRTMVGTAVNGSICAVEASGMRSMSDSSMVWKPRMDEPSKPRPSSKMPSFSSETGIEKCCQRPGRSMKRRSMILTPFSLAIFNTSFGVMRSASFAMTWEQNAGPAERRWPAGPDTLCGCQDPVKTAAFLARGTLGLGGAHRLRKRATAAAAHAVFSVGRAAEAIGPVGVDGLGGEDARGDRAPGAAHAVHADHVERVVIAQLGLEVARAVAED